MTEGEALLAIRSGDVSGLTWVMDTYTPYLTAIAGRIAGEYAGSSDIEELVSDVFVALWRGADRVKPDKLRAWLASVARHKTRDFLRVQRSALPLEDDELPWEMDLESDAQREELYAAVRKAVFSMEEPDREIFLRYYYFAESVKAIAKTMNRKESTVKSRLHRGREALKNVLTKEGFADEG